MKYTEIKASGAVTTSVQANTLMLVCQTPETNPQSKVIYVSDFANSFNQPVQTGLPLMPSATPANSQITVAQGVMFYDDSYLYIATDTNNLKRVLLTAF